MHELKREIKKLEMRLYRQKMSEKRRQEICNYDKKRAASTRLKVAVERSNAKSNACERKRKSRALQVIPKTQRKFEKLVDNVCNVAKSSPTKAKYVMKKLRKVREERKSEKPPILQLKSFKSQNRIENHAKLVSVLIDRYGGKRAAAEALNLHYTTFQRLTQPPLKRIRLVTNNCRQVRKFFEQEDISLQLAGFRSHGRRYLRRTLEETHTLYKSNCLKNKVKPVAFSTFCKLRPKDVFRMGQTPDRQCICDICENFRLKRQAFGLHGIKGIESHTDSCIKQSLCKVLEDDSNAGSNDSPLHQVDPEYGHLNCILRHCEKCGPGFVALDIVKANKGLRESKELVTWKKWEFVVNPETKFRRLELVTHASTRLELVKQYCEDLRSMSFHLFSCNWNYAQFVHCKENLKPGQLLQVLDFGQNYMNIYQDEPQSVHWDHSQTVIHPIVNYYINAAGVLVTEEHVMITADKKHDKFAVRAFEAVTLERLAKNGFVPKQVIQFCDNCAGQYKSKGPFQFISDAGIPTIRMFFGARHGKGPADGVVGRVKSAVHLAVKGRQVVIRNALEFVKYCAEKFAVNSYDSLKKQKFIQEFFYVDNIKREEEIVAVTSSHTRSFYSIRSTGKFCVIEARQVSCCCDSCLEDGGINCPNQAYASKWIALDLHTGKPLVGDCFFNRHWEKAPRCGQAEDKPAGKGGKRKRSGDSNAAPGKVSNGDVDKGEFVARLVKMESTDDGIQPEVDDVFDWKTIYEDLQKFTNYFDMEEYILTVESSHLLHSEIQKVKKSWVTDGVALGAKPRGCSANLIPITTTGDGNCLPRSISTAVYGNQSRHLEIRIRLLIELVKNKRYYLDENYLGLGTRFRNQGCTFASMYAEWSGQHIPMQRDNIEEIIEMIYNNEVLAMRLNHTYMGLWQMWAASNVLGRPLQTVFPDRGSAKFRPNYHRLLVPIDVSNRKKEPLHIMWTPVVPNGEICHFVPLLKK